MTLPGQGAERAPAAGLAGAVARFVVAHARPLLLALLVAAAALAYPAGRLEVDPSQESLFLTTDPAYAALAEFNATFGADETIVVALRGDGIFTRAGLGRLDRLTEELAAIAHVESALSPTTARDIVKGGVEVYGWAPFERVRDGEATPEEFRAACLESPLFRGNLVSADGSAVAIVLALARAEGDRRYRRAAVEAVRAAARAVESEGLGGARVEVHAAGIPLEKTDVADFIRHDQQVLIPLVLAVFVALLLPTYRSLLGVVLPIATVGVSLTFCMGHYALFGRQLNAVTSLLTPAVMVISVENAIHLLSRYLEERRATQSAEVAAERTLAALLAPCFLTSFTTAIGFASNAVSAVPAITEFGAFAASGVMLAFAVAIVLVPGALAGSGGRLAPEAHRPTSPSSRALAALGRAVRPLRFALTGAALLGTLAALRGATRLQIETDLIESLPADAPLYRATRFIDATLGGVNTVELIVDGGGPGAFRDVRNLARLEALRAGLETEPSVAKAMAVTDFLKRIHQVRRGLGPEGFALPAEQEQVSYYLGLLERSKDPILPRFLDPEARRARVTARVRAVSTRESQALLRRLSERTQRDLAPAGLAVRPTGSFVILSDMSQVIVENQLKSFALSLALIVASLAVVFRSVKLGLLAAIPNCLPVAWVYGLMGEAGIPLSVPTAMIASVALGLAVDNTIHFIARARDLFAACGSHEAAVVATLAETGRPIVASGFVLVAGFAVGVLGSFRPLQQFSVLIGVALTSAVVCALAILPAAILILRPFGPERRS